MYPLAIRGKRNKQPNNCYSSYKNDKSTCERALLTALKASSSVLLVEVVVVLLAGDFLDNLLEEDFLFWGSAGGGTCSLFCFFPIFSRLSYRVSDIFRGAEGDEAVVNGRTYGSFSTNSTFLQTVFASFMYPLRRSLIYPSWAVKVKLIHETLVFPAPFAFSPHIQCFTYPIQPPSKACITDWYYSIQYSCNTNYNPQRNSVKHQQHSLYYAVCYLWPLSTPSSSPALKPKYI